MFAREIRVRRAGRPDQAALIDMQAASFRDIGRTYYASDAVESFIRHVGTMDAELLDEGRYFIADMGGAIAACGGWSMRTPRYAAFERHGGAEETTEPVVRSVFVHPRLARLGLGRRILAEIELDIAATGYRTATLTALLSALAFYRKLGFADAGRSALRLPDGLLFPCARMRKSLSAATSLAA